MKIAFFEVSKEEQNALSSFLTGSDFNISFCEDKLTVENVNSVKDAEIISVFINSEINKEIIDQLPNLKLIATRSTGFDHIDLNACKEKGIIVSNVKGYGEITVAEHTFALLLSISRRIIESYERVKSGYFSPEGLTGFDLAGKTLGVLGVGCIGTHVIEIAKGFSMKVVAYKRTPDEALAAKLGFEYVDMDTLIANSDVISLHIPYSKETHHIINEEMIGKMKKGVIILNTARGPLIDTNAILKYLENGKLGGVGIDVCENEPMLREEKQILSREFNKEDLLCLLEEKMLLNYRNVVITPHNGFNSHEALELILSTTVANIEGFKNNTPQNIVQ